MASIPPKCINCVYHKKSQSVVQGVVVSECDYCDYIEHWNGYANTPVPYPYFYKQEYPCPGHKEAVQDDTLTK